MNSNHIAARQVLSKKGLPLKCPICGGKLFIPGPLGRMENNLPPRCIKCRSLDRHRIIFEKWNAVKQIIDLSAMSCLQFSKDCSISGSWFGTYTVSIYGSENSIDIQNIPYNNDTWDVIVANHVLEHIPDDVLALKELARVLKPAGILQITVPSPMTLPITDDWGFPDPDQHEHYRLFGRDIVSKFHAAFPDGFLFYIVGIDPITGGSELIFFLSNDKNLARLGDVLPSGCCLRLRPDSVIETAEWDVLQQKHKASMRAETQKTWNFVYSKYFFGVLGKLFTAIDHLWKQSKTQNSPWHKED